VHEDWRRDQNGEVLIPRSDTHLRAGDHIVALVTYSNLQLAEALLGAETKRV
jgi:trk system potassium uptake protein TrkA